jgi:hypothetical protein
MKKRKFVATVVVTVFEDDACSKPITKAQVSKALRDGNCYIEDNQYRQLGFIDKIAVRNIDID